MNTYLVPIVNDEGVFIKKLIARNLEHAKEKLHKFFMDKYEWLEGDDLEEIRTPLSEDGVEFGDIYDIEVFT